MIRISRRPKPAALTAALVSGLLAVTLAGPLRRAARHHPQRPEGPPARPPNVWFLFPTSTGATAAAAFSALERRCRWTTTTRPPVLFGWH